MFRNAPEIVLPGHYWFAPEGTPHFPGISFYGSANWMKGEWGFDPALGERGAQRWNNGRPPDRLPLPKVVGTKECLEHGAEWPVPPDLPRTIVDGFDSRCFLVTFDPDIAKMQILFAVEAPALQAAYARLVELVYQEEFAQVHAILVEWFGNPVTLTSFPQQGNLPARAYINFGGRGWLVIISGTTNFQELATQAFATLAGPTNFGAYSTNALWNLAASQIATELFDAGADADQPISFTGHSYGAAVASLLAARYRFWQPGRDISVVTFGLPKPGDDRVARYLNATRQVAIAATDDIVVSLPPDLNELLPFAGLVPAALRARWETWQEMPSYLMLTPAGVAAPGRPAFLDAGILAPLLNDVLGGDPLPTFTGHPIARYRDRLWLRQPGAAWPVPESAWRLLFPVFIAHGGVRGGGRAGDLAGVIVAAGGALGGGAAE